MRVRTLLLAVVAAALVAAPSLGGTGAVAADAGGPPQFATYLVYAVQYEPAKAGSVEAEVPDKCAKFAALSKTRALRREKCPAGYKPGLDYRVTVARLTGPSATLPVKEVGPWNTDDNFWDFGADSARPRRAFTILPPGLSEAQAAFSKGFNKVPNCLDADGRPSGHAGGADQFGHCVTNPAGIGISSAAAAKLGIPPGKGEWVRVTYLWEPLRYAIVSVNSGKNADVEASSKDPGARVLQWPTTGKPNQQWRLDPVAASAYKIESVNSGLVLNVSGGSTADGAQIIQWPWQGDTNEQWRFESVGEGIYRIVSVKSGKVIDTSGGSTADGAPLVQATWTGAASQQWRLVAVGDG